MGEICEITIGGTPKRKVAEYWSGNNPWVSVSELNGSIICNTKELITDLGVQNSNVKLIPEGTLLLSFKLSIGKVGIAGRNLYTNEAIAGLIIKKEEIVNSKFLFYIIPTLNLKKYGQGAAKGICLNKKILNTLRIPLPPIKTQQKIIKILDKADIIRKKRQMTDEITDQILRATFIEMFGDPIANPLEWDTDIIDNYTSKKATKGSTPTTYGYKWEDKGILFLRSECITQNGVSLNGSMHISQDAHNSMERSKIIPGDILIRITGDVGISTIFPKHLTEANINQHIAIVRLKENCGIHPLFLVTQLNTEYFRNYFISITRGVTHPHLSLQQIRETTIIIPPFSLQEKFVETVKIIDVMREKQVKSKMHIEEMFQGLMEKAFKGEIVQ